MLSLRYTSAFKKDLAKAKKRGQDLTLLKEVIEMLQKEQKLDDKYKDHELTGNMKGFRECHVSPDWLLIYKVEKSELVLVLTRTGSHSDLFR